MPSKLFLAIIVAVAGCRLLTLGASCALCVVRCVVSWQATLELRRLGIDETCSTEDRPRDIKRNKTLYELRCQNYHLLTYSMRSVLTCN